MGDPHLGYEARVAINLVDPEIPPDEDPKNERIDVEKTLEMRKALSEVARKEHQPGGTPMLARSAHKLWTPQSGPSDIRVANEDEVESVAATREDGCQAFHVCCKCAYYHHEEGQRLLWNTDLSEQYRAGLGAAGVQRLGDLREYGYCGAEDRLTHPFGPMCQHFTDGSKILGKMIGGAVGLWRRVGGI